jgi:competence protein ComEA
MAFRDRLDTLSRGELAGLIVVVVLTLAGAGLWYLRSLPKPVQIASNGAPVTAAGIAGGSSTSVAGASASASAAPIIVDITGSVRHPGVYEFVQGDRVIDAVERAGGAKPNADLTTLNLAALLADGTQIVVPKQGSGGALGATGSGDSSSSAGGLININTATATEFETLSGIGEVLAAAIVDYRTENGPFTSVDELEDVSGIGPATLEEIRDSVTT